MFFFVPCVFLLATYLVCLLPDLLGMVQICFRQKQQITITKKANIELSFFSFKQKFPIKESYESIENPQFSNRILHATEGTQADPTAIRASTWTASETSEQFVVVRCGFSRRMQGLVWGLVLDRHVEKFSTVPCLVDVQKCMQNNFNVFQISCVCLGYLLCSSG